MMRSIPVGASADLRVLHKKIGGLGETLVQARCSSRPHGKLSGTHRGGQTFKKVPSQRRTRILEGEIRWVRVSCQDRECERPAIVNQDLRSALDETLHSFVAPCRHTHDTIQQHQSGRRDESPTSELFPAFIAFCTAAQEILVYLANSGRHRYERNHSHNRTGASARGIGDRHWVVLLQFGTGLGWHRCPVSI